MAATPRSTYQTRFKDTTAAELGELIEPTVRSCGLVLEELELKPNPDRMLLRVVVDYETGTENVSLDTLAEVSEALNTVLDNHDDVAPLASLDTYHLEVSTPGATRPLITARHYRRNIGHLLDIDQEGAASMTARLLEVDEAGITVQEVIPPPKKGMKPKKGPDTHIGFDAITRARVQVEFSHSE